MKIIQKKCLFTSLLLAMAMTVSLPANAYRGGWGVGAGLIAGGIIGAELSRPYYYPPAYVYAPPPVVVQQQPILVQQPAYVSSQPQQASTSNVWNYCESLKTYYPYAQSCPEGWKQVPASPPPPPR